MSQLLLVANVTLARRVQVKREHRFLLLLSNKQCFIEMRRITIISDIDQVSIMLLLGKNAKSSSKILLQNIPLSGGKTL
jgi:hypothetical protein